MSIATHLSNQQFPLLLTFFSLHGNRDGHIAGLMEAKPEELGTICPNRKDASILRSTILYSCKFSVGAIC